MTARDEFEPVIVRAPDGLALDAWPHIVQYEITEGEHKGTILDTPPTRKTFPAPRSTDPHSGRDVTRKDASAAFRLIVHDYVAYTVLVATGKLTSLRHTGGSGELQETRRPDEIQHSKKGE